MKDVSMEVRENRKSGNHGFSHMKYGGVVLYIYLSTDPLMQDVV